MSTTVENVVAKTPDVEIDPKSAAEKVTNGAAKEGSHENGTKATAGAEEEAKQENVQEQVVKKEVPLQLEPKSGVSFAVELDDGKQLFAAGLRKKSMFGVGIKVYGFGMYTDNEKMKEVMKSKIGKCPTKPTKEMYQAVIDSDFGMTVKMVIVYTSLTMSMVKKSFDEGLGAAIKKLTGGKNDELIKKLLGEASDDMKLPKDSVIEITRLPGYTLQTTVMGKVVSKVESELLCRAYCYLYLGEDPLDKEAKEKFGTSLLSLF
ncbi:hypothetical protein DCAR_0624487 [Daucus carota subsp. sativus]|uniref:Uncharacterized protein n=1 Tax=Daucus carota subsp. sativus TaxID=79200 RepID=A0A161YDS7_DAUCS|nr:PREDICTED: fatty-acid-binding protein 1-like [Daucus carota subsp. sativus]WOH05075.1 hypothetical protein DCAR_0624487 [Daucus carota subsp. sativus]